MPQTFGPSAVTRKDGTITAYCMRAEYWCFKHWHTKCGAEEPARDFSPEDMREHTAPDWCKWRDGIIEDARNASATEETGSE